MEIIPKRMRKFLEQNKEIIDGELGEGKTKEILDVGIRSRDELFSLNEIVRRKSEQDLK